MKKHEPPPRFRGHNTQQRVSYKDHSWSRKTISAFEHTIRDIHHEREL